MATIDDLNKSISQMTETELYDRLRELRKARRVQKVVSTPVKRAAKATKPKAANQLSLTDLLSAMTADEKAQLLKELEG